MTTVKISLWDWNLKLPSLPCIAFTNFTKLNPWLKKQGPTRHRPLAHPVVLDIFPTRQWYISYSNMFAQHSIHRLRQCPVAWTKIPNCWLVGHSWWQMMLIPRECFAKISDFLKRNWLRAAHSLQWVYNGKNLQKPKIFICATKTHLYELPHINED